MQELMFATTFDVIGEIGFGVEFNTVGSKSPSPFSSSFDSSQSRIIKRHMQPLWNVPVLGQLLYQNEREMAENIKILDKCGFDIIVQRRKEMEEKEDALMGNQDILSLFLTEKLSLSDSMLRDIVMYFMIAGRGTTACTLTFSLLMFAQNPDQQEKAREEVLKVLGSSSKRFATITEIADMKYLWGFVHESFRLYPPVPSDPKIAVEDDVLPNGDRFFAGQRIFYEHYIMGRILPMFKDDEPLKCKPESWLKMEKLPSSYEFPVFQAGPRICLGQSFALLEAQMVLAYVLSSGYLFEFLPNRVYTYQPGITLSVKDGLFLKVSRKSGF